MASRRHKFGAIATYVCSGCFLWGDGEKCIACKGTKFIRFDSKAEAKRFATLCLMEKAGEITGLMRQPRFPVRIKGIQVLEYVADFAYHRAGRYVVEDVKGVETGEFKIKRRCVEAEYGPGFKISVVAA